MNYAHVDSSHLLRTLGAFLPGQNFHNDELAVDAIDLLSHLLCRKELFYDGAVFGTQRAKLDATFAAVRKQLSPSSQLIFDRKFVAASFAEEDEIPMIKTAIELTAGNAEHLSREITGLDAQLSACAAIASADEFSAAVKDVLLVKLGNPGPQVDAILTDKSIAGRRFIWAALKEEPVRVKFQRAAAKSQDPLKLFQLLFSHFRAEFAVARNRQLVKHRGIGARDIFYAPEVSRADLLAIAFQTHQPLPELSANLEIGRTAQSAWFKRTGDTTRKSSYLPLSLLFALSRQRDAALRPIDFLNLVLEHSASDEAGKLASSLNSLPGHFLGHDNQAKFLEEFREDLALAQKHQAATLPLGSKEELSVVLALATLFVGAPPAAVGLGILATGGPYLIGRLRVTRRKAGAIADVLPTDWKEPHYIERFRTVFGRTPPKR